MSNTKKQNPARAELILIGVVFSILLIYISFVVLSPVATFQEFSILFFEYLLASLMLAGIVLVFALIVLIVRLYSAENPRDHLLKILSDRWHHDRFILIVAPVVIFPLMLSPFNLFKQRILPGAGFELDPLFRDLDRALFLGNDPWVITHKIFSSPLATAAIDSIYHTWFILAAAILIIPVLSRSAHTRATVMISYVLTWIIVGSVLAYGMGSAGPCFYNDLVGPDASFQALMENLRSDREASGLLVSLSTQQHLLDLRGTDKLAFGGGISAMPSVHVSLTVLFAIILFRINAVLRIVGIGYVLFIWMGSIHLGWHYALDGIVGGIVTIAIWYASSWGVSFVIAQVDQRKQLYPSYSTPPCS